MQILNFWTARFIMLLFVAFAISPAAAAEPISINCENEDVLAANWKGPMTVTYDGEASGTLIVKSDHIDLTLPATSKVRTGEVDGSPKTATAIEGFGETKSVMPDLAALEACAVKTVQPDFKDDADMVAIARISCLVTTPPSAAPVTVKASVTVGLSPGETAGAPDVIVEIKRTYSETTAAAGKAVSIETFPKNCAITAK